MLWKSVLSQQARLSAAINECCDRLKDFPRPIDLALVFVQSSLRQEMELIPQQLRRRLEPAHLLGCSGGGVVGEGLEIEGSPALSVTVAQLPEVALNGFHLQEDDLPSPDAPPEAWREALGLSQWQSQPSFLLLVDAFEFDPLLLLEGLDYAYPRSPKLGGLASDAQQSGGNRLCLNHHLYSRGAVGLALGGNIRMDSLVAQGCRPIGRPMTITRGERNFVLELDGRSPLEQLEKTLRSLSPRDKQVAQNSLFVGIAAEPELSLDGLLGVSSPPSQRRGQFLIRNLVALQRQALVIGAQVRSGQKLQFHLRDAQASAQELEQLLQLQARQGLSPQAALLFSCTGRGEYLYKQPHHDSQQFCQRFPQASLGGFFCNGEIGPVGQTSYLHGYTSCFAMISPGG